MRNILYLVLAAAGITGLAFLLCRRGGACCGPARKAEAMLESCRSLLSGLENATSDRESPPPETASS